MIYIETGSDDVYYNFGLEYYFTVEKKLPEMEEEQARNANLLILKLFFLKEYVPEDFYGQFEDRMRIAEEAFEI